MLEYAQVSRGAALWVVGCPPLEGRDSRPLGWRGARALGTRRSELLWPGWVDRLQAWAGQFRPRRRGHPRISARTRPLGGPRRGLAGVRPRRKAVLRRRPRVGCWGPVGARAEFISSKGWTSREAAGAAIPSPDPGGGRQWGAAARGLAPLGRAPRPGRTDAGTCARPAAPRGCEIAEGPAPGPTAHVRPEWEEACAPPADPPRGSSREMTLRAPRRPPRPGSSAGEMGVCSWAPRKRKPPSR